jgi:hypothetical protein
MGDQIVVDFSKAIPPEQQPDPRVEPPSSDSSSSGSDSSTQSGLESTQGSQLQQPLDRPVADDEVEGIKAAFVRTGGNLAQVAREFSTSPARVKSLALKNGWTLYGRAKSSHEKASTSRLQALSQSLEAKLYELLASLEVETKEYHDVTKDGLNSQYVANLASRNSAFKDVFDRYMRVQALLEPEVFGEDKNSAARLAQQKASSSDGLGGVEGVNRQITALIAGVVVTEDQVSKPPDMEAAQTIEATPSPNEPANEPVNDPAPSPGEDDVDPDSNTDPDASDLSE